MDNVLLQWRAHEYRHHDRGIGWYATFIIIAVLFVGFEIFVFKDGYGALTLAIIFAILFLFALIRPREQDVLITDRAIYLDDYAVPFHSVRRFWIVDHSDAKALHLETSAYLNRFVVIELNEQDPVKVSEVLSQFLIETTPNVEHLSHKIARKLRY